MFPYSISQSNAIRIESNWFILEKLKTKSEPSYWSNHKHYRVTEAYDALSPCSEWDGERIHKEHGTILALC